MALGSLRVLSNMLLLSLGVPLGALTACSSDDAPSDADGGATASGGKGGTGSAGVSGNGAAGGGPSGGTSPTGGQGAASGSGAGGSATAGSGGGSAGTAGAGGDGDSGGVAAGGMNSGGAGAVGGSAGAGGVGGQSGDWWNAAWKQRSRVTITDAGATAEQSDFQLPVRLDAASLDYAATSEGGKDLRFVTSTGEVLKHQIDTWEPTGTSVIWLRLPKLTAAPTSLWLYYGNAAAEPLPAADAQAVWPTPYAGVWHLSGDAKDATSQGFDGASVVGGSFAAAKLGKGFKLTRSAHDHIELKHDIKVLAGASGCTFSAWINPTDVEDTVNGMVIITLGKWFSNNHNSYADFNVNADGQMISHIDPGTNTAAGGYTRVNSKSGIVQANQWAWVTYKIDLTNSRELFYKNGALADTKTATFNAKTFIDMVSSRVVIGTEEDNIDHWYGGSLDELRIETTLRSDAWIAAQYRAMTASGFATVQKSP